MQPEHLRSLYRQLPIGVRRAINWIRWRLATWGTAVAYERVTVGDVSFTVEARALSDRRAARQTVSREEVFVAALLDELPRSSVFIDVGANIGFFSLLVKATSPAMEVHAIEAHRLIAQQLDRSAERNAFQIHVHPLGVSDYNGWGGFRQSGRSGGSVAALDDDERDAIPIRTLDHLIETGEVPAPDLVKIDVEGHEFQVLNGMRRTLRDAQPTVLLELHRALMRSHSHTVEELFGLIHQVGYRSEKLRRPGHGSAHRQEHWILRPGVLADDEGVL